MTVLSTLRPIKEELVYLVIPPELDGTNRVKLGRSNSNTDDRINSYGKDTKVLHRISVNNSIFVEKRLKDKFKDKFNSFKKEYFEGDIDEMKKEFLIVVVQCLSDTPTDEENTIITKISEEEQEINIQEQKIDELQKKLEEEIVMKKKVLKDFKNENKKKQLEDRLAKINKKFNDEKLILEIKIKDEEYKLSRKRYYISIEDQCKIKENIEIDLGHRTSKQEFLDFITLNKINVSKNDLLKFLTSIPGIIYDKNLTKKVKDRRDRGIFIGVHLKLPK